MSKHGCYNRTMAKGYYAINREYYPNGKFVFKQVFIPHIASTNCRYDNKRTDPKCKGCNHKEDGC